MPRFRGEVRFESWYGSRVETVPSVRAVHIPTGLAVTSAGERSGLANKERALRELAGLVRGAVSKRAGSWRERLAAEGKATALPCPSCGAGHWRELEPAEGALGRTVSGSAWVEHSPDCPGRSG